MFTQAQELPIAQLLVVNGGFYDPHLVTDLRFIPRKKLERAAIDLTRRFSLTKSRLDKAKIILVMIDYQYDFCHPQGAMFLGGRNGNAAVNDSRRLVEFIYRNLPVLSRLYCSVNTYLTYQIIFSSFLVNQEGEHPEDYTVISTADIKAERWLPSPSMCSILDLNPIGARRYLEFYCEKLQRDGHHQLTIWPYHGMIASEGGALISGLQEAMQVHALTRGVQPRIVTRTLSPLTEGYSIFGPEVITGPNYLKIPGAERNDDLIAEILSADITIIAGQPMSHGVIWTLRDLLKVISKNNPLHASKLYLLGDCMTPIKRPGFDFTSEAKAAVRRFSDDGVHVVNSTTSISSWPGVEL